MRNGHRKILSALAKKLIVKMESLVFLLLILLLQTASLVQGEIVGAFVLPHGELEWHNILTAFRI